MIKPKKKGSLIVLSGVTAVGKDTIFKELLLINKNLVPSISCTTRKIRPGEVDGVDYYFITKKQFEEKIQNNEMLEYATVHQHDYYGTPKAAIEKNLDKGKDVVLVIDIQGAMQIKEKFNDALFIFIMPPSMVEIRKRLIKRGTTDEEEIYRRFKSAYKELNYVTKYNYAVINDELDDAVQKVNSIIISEKCRIDRIEQFDLGTEEEFLHECLIDENCL
ncbi:MAG: guanylate kinase [Bacilli bacterium]